MHVMARVDPHAIHARCRRRASGMDRRRQGRQPAPALGLPRRLGDLRLLATTTSTSCPRCSRRSTREVRHRRHLRQSLAGPRRLLLRAAARPISAPPRATTCRARPIPTIRCGRPGPHWRRTVLTRLVVAVGRGGEERSRPHASFIPNMGRASLMEFDLDGHQRYCPFLCVDDQGRRGIEPIWSAGRNGKRMRATFPDRPVVLITSIGPEEAYRWKDSVTTGPEIAGLDRQRHHPGAAPLVHQVQRRRARQPLGRAGGRQLRPACRARAGAVGDAADRRDRRSSTRRRHCGISARRPAPWPRPTISASTMRWSRRGCRSRWSRTSR